MNSEDDSGYEFADQLPINEIERGSTVLVAGPALSPATDLAFSMVAAGAANNQGSLFISTNRTVSKLVSDCRELHPDLNPSRMGVVDCTGQEVRDSDTEVVTRYVSTQSDLTGIGMKYTELYEALYPACENGNIRTGLATLSSLVMYLDLREVFRFAQTVSNRIESAGGLGVFNIDPSMHDEKTVSTMIQLVDAVIEVRDPVTETPQDADGELRVRGFRDQSSEWQPFTLL